MTLEEYIITHQKVAVEEYPNRVLKMVPHPVVSCRISTYNHAPYIAQCIDSMLMQETDFPFEIVIGEDESSDGTREICIAYAKKHPDKIRLFLHSRENNIRIDGKPSARFQILFSIMSCRGKYQAMCEGDDYWTDPLLLQKHVEIIKGNSCATHIGAIAEIVKNGKKTQKYFGNYADLDDGQMVRKYRLFKFNSLLIRKDFLISLFEKYMGSIPLNEYTLNNLFFEYGVGIYHKAVVCVYNVTGHGVYTGSELHARNTLHYNLVKKLRKMLKKNWSFLAFQELVTYSIISFIDLKNSKSVHFFKLNFIESAKLFLLFVLRFGFITCIPQVFHWSKEKKNSSVIFEN
jgi:glycosyltransferase involved in cell wall biosynthesis